MHSDVGLSRVLLPSTPRPSRPVMGMSILGEYPLLERLDRGVGSLGFGFGALEPAPGFRPLPPRLWRPTVWGSPPPPPCPPPPVPSLPLCPGPCHVPALPGVGAVSHLFDYMVSARHWYPWYYNGMYASTCEQGVCCVKTPLDFNYGYSLFVF